MNVPGAAQRSEFTVRCACGTEYHTNADHIGKRFACRCGRTVEVARPPEPKRTARNLAVEATSASHRHSSRPGELFTGTVDGKTAEELRSRRRRRSRRGEHGEHGHAPHYAGRSRFERATFAVSVWLANMLRPVLSPSWLTRTTAQLSWLYFIAAIASWGVLHFTADRWLPGSIIAYGPRFVALWPLAVLVPLAAIAARTTLWPLALGACIVLGPIMGARLSVRTLSAAVATSGAPVAPAPGTIRLITYNTDGGGRLSYDLPIFIREQKPDIVTFQECNDKLWAALQAEPGWYSEREDGLCTGSRFKITNAEAMPREDLERVSRRGFGGAGYVMRTEIATPGKPISVINLHLETARKGLEGMLGKQGFVPDHPFASGDNARQSLDDREMQVTRNDDRYEINALIRSTESARASHYVSQGMNVTPIVVAGDFNMPVESTIFQEFWRAFTDAFELRGNGFGWSKREGRWLRIRIDHVLTNALAPQPLTVRIGPDYSSDHRPVIVDMAWPAR